MHHALWQQLPWILVEVAAAAAAAADACSTDECTLPCTLQQTGFFKVHAWQSNKDKE